MTTEEIIRQALGLWAGQNHTPLYVDVQEKADDYVTVRVQVDDRRVRSCDRCGKRIVFDAPPKRETKVLCRECRGDRVATRAVLMERQGGRCIVAGCPYDVELMGNMDVHRIVPGRLNGKYAPENCVLVCRWHHGVIEGMSLRKIREQRCTARQYETVSLAMEYRRTEHLAKMKEREEAVLTQGYMRFVEEMTRGKYDGL